MSIHFPASVLAPILRTESSTVDDSDSDSTDNDSQDNNFDGWDDPALDSQPCHSLFCCTDTADGDMSASDTRRVDEVFTDARAALAHDREAHGFHFEAVCTRMGLDFYGRIRLINYIRKHKPSPATIHDLTGKEAFLSADEYLIPVIEGDPLLQLDFDGPGVDSDSDSWSEDDEDNRADKQNANPISDDGGKAADLLSAHRRIRHLERKLADARCDMSDYRAFVVERLDVRRVVAELGASDTGGASGSGRTGSVGDQETEERKVGRDDDTHYFQSYGENDIHAVMLLDEIRTSTYASFILSARRPAVSPDLIASASRGLFQDAIVLDVGCGTGILSLFAARAGARHVYAVDASDVASKAKEIVKANGMEDVISVINGKIEDITLPLPPGVSHVDIIISEWMGYALLYESMLDSVLWARDRWLRPAGTRDVGGEENDAHANVEAITKTNNDEGGLMVPSQCRIMLALCEASEVWKERIGFWGDVYGFDMTAMSHGVYSEAIVDVVPPDSLASEPFCVKDLPIQTIQPSQLSFSAPFVLKSNTSQAQSSRAPQTRSPQSHTRSMSASSINLCGDRTKIHALVLYFDTFFNTSPHPIPEETAVRVVRSGEGVREVWRVGGGRSRSRDGGKEKEEKDSGKGEGIKNKAKDGGDRSTVTTAKSPACMPTVRKFSEHKRRDTCSLDDPQIMSFSTGPASQPTHWKQTLFLLREPIFIGDDTTVTGTFYMKKSADNSRELDVEIHYSVNHGNDDVEGKQKEKEQDETIVQMYKVR
ncbi:S-adenosyl-L-methionine-dependent methyltransferase [Hygrophoropsis aurantiaca]|uniref:S-adenosyl-L-methionine-dependent methyltransferase n=1 Tax=Hygrophoropsis aurantiaca TaxID=72124 RepID=A0ACB8ACN5_9AGAM|nr:S-adenosyl-L-methionine-dependent methyltransferase [Hygrophoropsis aurantiaca]